MRSNVPGQLGIVEFTSITRIRETFLDDQYRNTNQTLGKWSIQSDTLNKLETVFKCRLIVEFEPYSIIFGNHGRI